MSRETLYGKLEYFMYCSKCGVKQADSATFCSSCGAKIGISEQQLPKRSDGASAVRSRLTLKPLHYPFTSAIGIAIIGWSLGKPWNEEFAGVVVTAFFLGLVVACIEIAFRYFRR